MNKSHSKKLNIFAVIVIVALLITIIISFVQSNDGIHIALIGPMTGDTAINGQAYLKGVKMAVEEINQQGGINDQKILIDVYDDQNNFEIARQQAEKIANDNHAMLVIGHNYSSCSIAGGQVYLKNKIPAITPTSTNPSVTITNPYYFRITFNDNLQGRFLGNYAKKVLHCKAACIISESREYGRNLSEIFKKTLQELDTPVFLHEFFDVSDKSLEQDLDQIVKKLKQTLDQQHESPIIIYLSVHSPQGVSLIRRIRDLKITNPIMTPDALASQSFVEGFSGLKKEKMSPGYYTDGIYVATPFIYDTAKESAQHFKENFIQRFNENPDWRAAFAFDAANLAIYAFKQAGVTGASSTIENERNAVRESLEQMNHIQYALEGITGFNYFDQNGDTPKPISIGVYKNNRLISALTQLQAVFNKNEIADVNQAINQERLVRVDGQLMYKTNVVYTGIELTEIKSIDYKDRVCTIDFYVWFRYQGEIDFQEIVFDNAIESIKLSNPIKTDQSGHIKYSAFHVVGTFKMDYLHHAYTPGEHLIGLRFHHHSLNANNLIFVTDIIGMRLRDNESIAERIQQPKILSNAHDCQVTKAMFHRNVIQKNSLGSLQFLNDKTGMIDYSCFNLEVWIIKNSLSLRGVIDNYYCNLILACLTFITLMIMNAFRTYLIQRCSRLSWILQSICMSTYLLTSECVLLEWFATRKNPRYMELIKLTFDVLWWVIPAYLINLAIRRFIWIPLEKKSNRSVPNILQNFLAFLVYLLAFFGVVAYVFDQKLTSLLATSGMVAMIIGLAIQVNIANIFSGIAINLENPFRINDWVKIGDDFSGKVVDITWRTIKIKKRDGSLLSLPNSIASESPIHNYNHPSQQFWNRIEIFVDPKHNPEVIKKILINAVLSVNGIVKTAEPTIRFELNEWAAVFIVFYCLDDYDLKFYYRSKVFEQAWIHLGRAAVRPAVRRQELYLYEGLAAPSAEEARRPITLLNEIDLFMYLSDDMKEDLSKRMHLHHFQPSDIIFKQGDRGNSLFIIREGVVGVWIKMEAGEAIEVARLGAGSFFGEMALLTGEPRNASIITKTETYMYEISKDDFSPIIESSPETAYKLSAELTQRSINREFLEDEYRTSQLDKEDLNKQFFNRIVNFFGVKKQQNYSGEEGDSDGESDGD